MMDKPQGLIVANLRSDQIRKHGHLLDISIVPILALTIYSHKLQVETFKAFF